MRVRKEGRREEGGRNAGRVRDEERKEEQGGGGSFHRKLRLSQRRGRVRRRAPRLAAATANTTSALALKPRHTLAVPR